MTFLKSMKTYFNMLMRLLMQTFILKSKATLTKKSMGVIQKKQLILFQRNSQSIPYIQQASIKRKKMNSLSRGHKLECAKRQE